MTRLLPSLLVLIAATPALGQTILLEGLDPTPAKPEPVPVEVPGTKRAMILCGHPGDAAHREVFAESIESLYETLTGQYGFAAENVHVLFGAESTDDDGPALKASRGVADRDRVFESIATVRRATKPEDTLWVVVLGHAHFDGRRSWWNLPGPDLNDREFGDAFRDLEAREQLFVITTAVSGYFVKGLSAKGRVIVTATEPDLEINEPFMHMALVDVLPDLPGNEEFDADEDGRLTMFDLYMALTRNIAERYVAAETIATEHARFDDNGDGQSTELQIDYLTEEQGGRDVEGRPKPIVAEGTDGWLSRSIVIEATPLPDDEETPDPDAESSDDSSDEDSPVEDSPESDASEN